MRWRLIAVLTVLAVVFVGAAPGLASEDEDACTPDCEIQASTLRFDQPVTVVEANSTVYWYAFDVYHTATSEPAAEDGPCLDVEIWPGEPTPAQFNISDEQLVTRTIDAFGNWTAWTACEEALRQPDGSFLLPYYCEIHRDTQRAALLIVPRSS